MDAANAARITVARGYKLYWPDAPIEARCLTEIAHLIHEMTHVWQYKYLGVGMYSLRWLDRRYGYVLTEGERLVDFGLEQQASIVEDYALSAFGLPLRRAKNKPSNVLLEKTVMGITRI